jgi:hypothetical protein
MANKISEARNDAINAMLHYALELTAAGYNKKCIRDSIAVLAADVIGDELP